MANIKYPKHLPLPLISGYGITPDDAIVRTEMESGLARQRKRFTTTPSKISVVWLMTREEFSLFEAWYKYHAKEGAMWFDIELIGGLGLVEQSARFTKQFTAKLKTNQRWEISSELEIRERPTLSAGALDILLDSDVIKLENSIDRLHNLVNVTLPQNII